MLEAVGIDEGDEVVVEIRDGIVIRPARRKIDVERLKESLRRLKERGSLGRGAGPDMLGGGVRALKAFIDAPLLIYQSR